MSNNGTLSICLVTSDIETIRSVKASCPPPNVIHVFSQDQLVNEHHTISDHGMHIVDKAADADAVLVEWSFQEAPAINTLCFRIRRDLLGPVLMVTREGPETLTACLAAGADDVIQLPVYLPLVQAHVLSYRRLIQAALLAEPNRANGLQDKPEHSELHFGPLRLSHRKHRFFIHDEEVELTPREFALLDYLLKQPGALLSRSDILNAVWGLNFDTGTNMVDVYMHYLRRKLDSRGLGDMIETVRGLGYRLIQAQD